MNGKKLIRNSTAEFLIFTGQAGEQSIEPLRGRNPVAVAEADGRVVRDGCAHRQRAPEEYLCQPETGRKSSYPEIPDNCQ